MLLRRKRMPTFLVMDGNNLLYRIIKGKSYPKLATNDGIPTGGVYGVLQSVHRLYASLFPAGGIMVFDGGLSERRRALFPDYKKYVCGVSVSRCWSSTGVRLMT
jgi:5'-3' exonuclease